MFAPHGCLLLEMRFASLLGRVQRLMCTSHVSLLSFFINSMTLMIDAIVLTSITSVS